MSTRRATALVGALVLALTACGGGGGDGDFGTVDEDGNVSIDGVNRLDDGELTVCSDLPYPPFEWDKDGETTGFDHAVVAAVGERLGVEVTFVPTPFPDIPGALVEGRCDAAASALAVTDALGEEVALSDPYADGDQALLIRAEDQPSVASLADLAGQPIGVRTGSAGAAYLAANLPTDAEAAELDEGAELLPALADGDVAALVLDAPVAALRQADEPERFVVVETFPTVDRYVLATAPPSESLLVVLNAALTQLREAGTLDELRSEWLEGPGE